MDFSNEWRSLFALSTLSSSLLSSSFGPLHFLPKLPSKILVSSLPSFPSAQVSSGSSLHSFFSTSSFLTHTSITSLSNSHFPVQEEEPFTSNLLCSLHLKSDPFKLVLFFPTGENFHHIGYTTLSEIHSSSITTGEVVVQKDGFKHPYHRILKISTVSVGLDDISSVDDYVEGFLIASTLYSVSWFRIECGKENGIVRMVSLAKQGFDRVVIDAKINSDCVESSIVLLENGELCWFDLESRRSGKVVVLGSFDRGLSGCEFGAQPWNVIVGCSTRIVVFDLRKENGKEAKTLIEKEGILAFCKCKFNDFLISVVTQRQLLLFDIRKPLVPVLSWVHGLCNPNYVCMFQLSELRPSEKYKWASDNGSVILVGSFWKDEFTFFFFGPKDGDTKYDRILYPWELPFKFPLSCDLGRKLMENVHSSSLESVNKEDVVLGFLIASKKYVDVKSECEGFSLVRYTMSGKLEVQRYYATWDHVNEKSNDKPDKLSMVIKSNEKKHGSSPRFHFLNVRCLCEYMNGSLLSRMVLNKAKLNEYFKKFPMDYIVKLRSMKIESSTTSIDTSINEATVPTSIFEITMRNVLNNLESDILPLAFSKYSLLIKHDHRTISTLLKVPKCLPHHSSIPFFVGEPLSTSEKHLMKSSQNDALVGPVLPVPVLLLHHWIANYMSSSSVTEQKNDDLVTQLCKTTWEKLYPKTSPAGPRKLENENPIFVFEKAIDGEGCANKKGKSTQKVLPQTKNSLEDEKFSTFICGIADKTYFTNSCIEKDKLDMFDQLNLYKLDLDSLSLACQPKEKEMFKRLTRQNYKWLDTYKADEDFCTSVGIPNQTR